ncbi:MAG: hypothetical protein NVS2B3_06980 [Vulcanimicrobiaceae bacterium]
MTLLAAFDVLLYRYTGQRDLVVGAPVANRTKTELEPLIGFFVNTLALRTTVDGALSFDTVLARVRETALSAFDHQDVPFERVIEEIEPERERGRQPLVNVMFFVRSHLGKPLELPALRLEAYPLESSSARFALAMRVTALPNGLECSLQYDVALFERERIEGMLRRFATLVRGIVAAPDTAVARLPLLSPAERHRLLVAWNDTAAPYDSDRPLHHIFEERARRAPDAVAVVAGETQLTYGALDARANRLARALRTRGVGRGSVVGICTDRTCEMVVATLAIAKAGAAYLPLDPQYPRERLEFMLRDARARAVLADRRYFDRFDRFGPGGSRAVIDVAGRRREACDDLASVCGPDDPAYVIYTSGSTGRPKGVVVPQRAVSRLVTGTDYVRIDAGDTIAQAASFSFDAATFEIWGALLNGARLCVVPRDVVVDATGLAGFLARHRVTIMFLTSALFRAIAARTPSAFRTLRCLIVGGETVDPASVRAVLAAGAPARLVNGYGPTEATTFACTYLIAEPPTGAVPIGRPIANTEAYVLDADRNLVPPGERGQLYLGGPGLALGYIDDDESTARSFVAHPFRKEPGARLYATGDVVRHLPSGDLAFVGRADRQVKIRGHRIEVGEIEAVLRADASLDDVAVCVREDDAGERRLVAYVVDRMRPPRTSAAWRETLARALPHYLVPSEVVAIPQMPLTPNGKIDLVALADRRPAAAISDPVATTDPIAQQLIGIWAGLLGIRAIGPNDDFFALGGHSLLTMRMLAEVESLFGRRIATSAFLEAPTVAHLATLARERSGPTHAADVVALQSEGTKTPLFFFHGDLWGGGYYTRRLARRLGRGRPVYVITPQGLGETPLATTIERMAREQLALVRGLRSSGPYLVGGYCSGGLVAFEVARLLTAGGDSVSHVILVDAPGANGRRAALVRPFRALASRFRCEAAGVALAGALAIGADLPRRAFRFVRRARERVRAGEARSTLALVLGRLARGRIFDDSTTSLEDAWRRLTARYVPRAYRGAVTLLVPELDRAERAQSTDGWRAVTSDLAVRSIPGGHDSCIARDLDETAACLRDVLDASDDPLERGDR